MDFSIYSHQLLIMTFFISSHSAFHFLTYCTDENARTVLNGSGQAGILPLFLISGKLSGFTSERHDCCRIFVGILYEFKDVPLYL